MHPRSLGVANRLSEIRKSRGEAAADLAGRVNVSRQTIYAIEAGTYVPNTEVALRLARELEVTVDELFSLPFKVRQSPDCLTADLLSATPVHRDQTVRICQIASHWVAVPVTPSSWCLPEADGIVKRAGKAGGRVDVTVLAREDAALPRLLLAGCDPATGLLAGVVERAGGVEIVSAQASSKLALEWLSAGKVHIAGSHLEEPATGEFNLPFLRRHYPAADFSVVTFARWEEGFVVARGNPLGLHKVEDLAAKKVRFVNREAGSGSRALLDRLLAKAGMKTTRVAGYEETAYGHLAAASRVLAGDADVCLATQAAARTFGLDFVPLHAERYDLVMHRRSLKLPAVQSFLDVLQRAALRRKMEALAGYDTSETGVLVA